MRYASIDMSQFVDYYTKFMKLLEEDEKEIVLRFTPLLKPIFDNRDGLKKFRNNWVGHIQEDDKFEENVADFINRINLPQKMEEYYYMIFAIKTFVDALQIIFDKDLKSLCEKFGKNDENRPLQPNNIDLAYKKFLSKMEDCRENFPKKHKSTIKPDDDLINQLLYKTSFDFDFILNSRPE